MVAKWNASVTNRYQLLPRCDDRGDESSAASELLARSETSARRVSRLAVERPRATPVAARSRAQGASCSPGAKRPRGGYPASQRATKCHARCGDESSAASELLARSETSARRVSRLAVERRIVRSL